MPLLGYAISLPQDLSFLETLTSEVLLTCGPMTSEVTSSTTSSPGLPGGRSPCASPDGPMIGLSGPEAVPVSRFRALANGAAMPTNDICGPLFTAASPSAHLQLYLENRLRASMDVNGCPLFVLTWRLQDMPSGPPICRLHARARGTPDSGCGSWPTMTATDSRGRFYSYDHGDHNKPRLSLLGLAQTLPTMTARDSRTLKGSQPPKRAKKSGSVLAWTVAKQMNRFIGRLNPEWVAWFMGYPKQWINCAPSETVSSRKSRPNS